jgi:hypothetical protein
MSESIIQNYIDDALASFRAYKKLAERALEQLEGEEFFATLDEESNSVAVIMKHMAGNMLSRWTDFLQSDGEICWLTGNEVGNVFLLLLNPCALRILGRRSRFVVKNTALFKRLTGR